MSGPLRHGTIVHPNGRSIEVLSERPEWLAYGVHAIRAHDGLVAAVRVCIGEILGCRAELRLTDREGETVRMARVALAKAEVAS